MNLQALKSSFLEKEIEKVNHQFIALLTKDFRMDRVSKKMAEWYTLEWTDFKKEILKSGEKLNYNAEVKWATLFHKEKEKVENLNNLKNNQ